jgi:hypothetical protein
MLANCAAGDAWIMATAVEHAQQLAPAQRWQLQGKTWAVLLSLFILRSQTSLEHCTA